jgi:hypothetical protein
MKHENRISKILEKKILKDEDPKLISEIETYLAGLEIHYSKWAKAHPNSLPIKDLQKQPPSRCKSLSINEI